MRSSWKLAPIDAPFFRNSFYNRVINSSTEPKLWTKGTRVFANLLDKNVQIYNGAKFIEVPIKREMAGSFLGSLILTKRITAAIHSKTRKNKKGRRKKKK